MLTLAMLIGLVITLLVVAMAMPKRKPGSTAPSSPLPAPSSQLLHSDLPAPSFPPPDRRTLRQRQIDEDAALLSDEFARYEDDRYRAEVRNRAARAFAPDAAPAIAAPVASPAPAAARAPAPASAAV